MTKPGETMSIYATYPNRTLCDVLKEMRACVKTRNFSHIHGLIEEAQFMSIRMLKGLERTEEDNEIK